MNELKLDSALAKKLVSAASKEAKVMAAESKKLQAEDILEKEEKTVTEEKTVKEEEAVKEEETVKEEE